MKRLFFTIGIAILSVTSCGYRTANQGAQFVGGYKLVAVPIFKNRSMEPKVEVFFTNALRNELHRANIAKVTDKEMAPISVEGVIDSVQYMKGSQSTGSGNDADGDALPVNAVITTQYQIRVVATLLVRRNADSKILWEARFTNDRSYLAPQIGTEVINSANALYNHSARLQNIEIIARDMMTEAYNRMTENF